MSVEREAIYQKVAAIVAERLHIDKKNITEQATFDSLGADSLSRVEIMLDIEEAFGIQVSDDDAEKIETLRDAVDYISNLQG